MYIPFSIKYIRWSSLVICLLSTTVFAEPYLAFKTNNKCSACHINPTGGGARNDFGAYYGAQILPETIDKTQTKNLGRITNSFSIGGDLRFNFDRRDNDAEQSSSFSTQSGQVYIAVEPENSRFSFYLDQQVAPGSAFSREAFILAKLKGNHYLKAGRIILPYGLRLEDDTAFIRQATQINFDNSDNGAELGLEFSNATLNFAISNGTTSDSNDDEEFQFAVRGEYIGNFWRAGSSVLVNDAEIGTRTMYNIFGGFNWNRFTVLAEVDRIEDESITNFFGDALNQTVSFLELNTEISKGYNLKLTTEYLDPDDDIDENERSRHSLLLEYTPFAYFQFRAGVRVGDDIPQRDVGNFTNYFLQGHMFF